MAIAGTVSFVPKGEYNAQTTYKRLNTVRYQNKVYVSLKTVVGVTPSDDKVNWMLFVDTTEIDPSEIAPEFSVAATRENIMTGESLPTLFGKIKKYFTDLKGHAFNDTVKNLTTEDEGSALDASQGKVLKGSIEELNSNLSVIGKCKNLLKPTLQTTTINGVTCTNNGDWTHTLSGTNSSSSSNVTFILNFNYSDFPTSTVKLVGCPALSEIGKVILQTFYNGTWGASSLWDTGKGVILENGQKLTKIAILVYPGKNVDGIVIKPMLSTNLNATYDDFVPYTGDGDTLMHDVTELKNDLYANTYNSQLNFVNCEYVAGGYTKIGNLAVVNIRIKCTNDGAVQLSGFPTYTNKITTEKNIVPVTVYNMTDENTTNIKYSALAMNGFINLLIGIADKEYSLSATYICD